MITIRQERRSDAAARETLLDARLRSGALRASRRERLREGRLPADGLSLVAVEDGRIVGTVRLWPVAAGPGPRRRCCSARSRSIRTAAAAASARR